MWVLCLNDMRSAKVEYLTPVARAATRDGLSELLEREKVEPYRDGQWGKEFRHGGPLEWFNPPYLFDEHRHFVDVGTREDAMQRAARHWDEEIGSLPELTAV